MTLVFSDVLKIKDTVQMVNLNVEFLLKHLKSDSFAVIIGLNRTLWQVGKQSFGRHFVCAASRLCNAQALARVLKSFVEIDRYISLKYGLNMLLLWTFVVSGIFWI